MCRVLHVRIPSRRKSSSPYHVSTIQQLIISIVYIDLSNIQKLRTLNSRQPGDTGLRGGWCPANIRSPAGDAERCSPEPDRSRRIARRTQRTVDVKSSARPPAGSARSGLTRCQNCRYSGSAAVGRDAHRLPGRSNDPAIVLVPESFLAAPCQARKERSSAEQTRAFAAIVRPIGPAGRRNAGAASRHEPAQSAGVARDSRLGLPATGCPIRPLEVTLASRQLRSPQ